MIPLCLDPGVLDLALVGDGPVALARLEKLRAAGAQALRVYAEAPSDALAEAAGPYLVRRLPREAEIAALHVLWIADPAAGVAEKLAAAARAAKTLVNTEDVRPLCDFHNVAEVRRGDLLITVSTGGRLAGLSGRVRRHLEAEFGEEWEDRLDRLEAERGRWQRDAVPFGRRMEELDEILTAERWLS